MDRDDAPPSATPPRRSSRARSSPGASVGTPSPRTGRADRSSTPRRSARRSPANPQADESSDLVPPPSSSDLPMSAPHSRSPVHMPSTPRTPVTPLMSSGNMPRNDLRPSRFTPATPATPATDDDLAGMGITSTSDPDLASTRIWGTEVNVKRTMDRFRAFLTEFRDENTGVAVYQALLQQIHHSEYFNINLDCEHLRSFDAALYSNLVRYPQEIVPIFDLVVNDVFREMYSESDAPKRIQVRTFNLEGTTQMRDLNPSDIDTMVSLQGMVTRCSGVIPELKQAFFKCNSCGHVETIFMDRGRIVEPTQCARCKASRSFVMVHNRSLFADRQQIKLQEAPEDIPEGETPHTVNLCAFDDLVDVVKPGDRVSVTGIFRAVPIRQSSNRRTLRSIYKTYIDVIHFKIIDKSRVGGQSIDDTNAAEYAAQQAQSEASSGLDSASGERFRAIAESGNVYERLVKSFAPSIWENDDVKRGLLCQMFGGVSQANGRRGDINILLCGDPSTSKSQLLTYVNKLAARGIYTSGKGSSAVGLTAYVTKDPDTREIVLESGALVLSDRGICCIDEFDKMDDSTRAILHEAMEQQTVSVAKAGIICSLNARTSVLAAANPKHSRYNPRESVVENLQLPPTLLSRFDLIYLILDRPDESNDRHLGRHLVQLFFQRSAQGADTARARADDSEAPLDRATLASYIAYARAHKPPEISEEASRDLIQGYVDMRKLSGNRKTITATPRQLESLIRLAEALAKMRLAEFVERRDVEEALRLMRVATQQAATDPITGTIDMDLINTGHSTAERDRVADIALKIRTLMTSGSASSFRLNQIRQELEREDDVSMRDINNAMRVLENDGFLRISGHSTNPVYTVL